MRYKERKKTFYLDKETGSIVEKSDRVFAAAEKVFGVRKQELKGYIKDVYVLNYRNMVIDRLYDIEVSIVEIASILKMPKEMVVKSLEFHDRTMAVKTTTFRRNLETASGWYQKMYAEFKKELYNKKDNKDDKQG